MGDSPQPEAQSSAPSGGSAASAPALQNDLTAWPVMPKPSLLQRVTRPLARLLPHSLSPRSISPRSISLGSISLPLAVAAFLVVAGTLASFFGAKAIANSDAKSARAAFPHTASGIASTVKLELAHEEDLVVASSTFFAAKPTASPAEFEAWVRWSQTLRRYPELQGLGFVTLAQVPELPTLRTRAKGQRLTRGPTPLTHSDAAVSNAAGAGPTYCPSTVELTRTSDARVPPGTDYCARVPRLLASRDTGHSVYAAAGAQGMAAVEVLSPVYRGNALPLTTFGRNAAFVGWARQVLAPSVVLAQLLQEHAGYAIHLHHASRPGSIAIASGTPLAGAQTATSRVHGGWTLRIFGSAPPSASISGDGEASAVLIVGIALSVLFAMLILTPGGSSAPAEAPQASTPPPDPLYDELTGLPNRALLLDRAERMLARAGRLSDSLVGALFIDIDWFKDINEKLGREAGDQLLKIVAERLMGVVRGHDTVGRLEGDKFVVLVESAARGMRLDSLARRTMESLHRPVELEGFGPTFSLTVSIGVAFGRYATPEQLLRDAEQAMHAAEAAGRDRYTMFNANMRSVIEGRGTLEVELQAGLEEHQLFLLYQPIFDLGSQKVAGLEAVIRWQHPSRGVLDADDFIPLAEETGLIVPIGRWALEQACARAASWNVAGHRAGVSLKVTANQLNRDGFATDVRRAVQQSGLEPSLLTLDVAETTAMHDLEATSEHLAEIKSLGVCIALDDLSSSYAHHAELQRLPLDALRVDRNSLGGSDDENYRDWLLEGVVALGHDLSLPVIATGVESYEQLATLQRLGFAMAQGSFTGKPSPAGAVENLFDREYPSEPAALAPTASEPPAATAPPTA